jgi:hypothetical protein
MFTDAGMNDCAAGNAGKAGNTGKSTYLVTVLAMSQSHVSGLIPTIKAHTTRSDFNGDADTVFWQA